MCEKVSLSNSNEEIGACITALTEKKNKESCYQCFKEKPGDCEKCMSHWYNGRNASIQILRNIFGLPSGQDVPKQIFYLSAEEAENFCNGIISEKFIKYMEKLRHHHDRGILIKAVPANEPCPSCNVSLPPSRLGYKLHGTEPVCWECDLARRNKEAC